MSPHPIRVTAALVLLALVAAACGSVAQTQSPSPTPPAPSQTADGALEPGTYSFALEEELAGLNLELTLSEGWVQSDTGVFEQLDGGEAREGVTVGLWPIPDAIWADSCHWQGTEVAFEPTIDSIASALAAQEPRNAVGPTQVTLGDHAAMQVGLTVPDDMDISTCDLYEGDGSFESWRYESGGARYHQDAGQRDLVRIVDVGGTIVLIDAAYWPELTDAQYEDMLSVLDSMRLTR